VVLLVHGSVFIAVTGAIPPPEPAQLGLSGV
jgi:hypothetical protein